MALFKKNKKEVSQYSAGNQEIPKLPELPQLPQFPSSQSGNIPRPNALPRFPSSSLGNKFSQNTIKEAVSGGKEDDVVNDFEKEIQKIPAPEQTLEPPEPAPEIEEQSQPPRYKKSKMMNEQVEESPYVSESSRRYAPSRPAGPEPVFIRIDKFEESMDIFEKIKKQVSGVDKILDEIKRVKEREDKELTDWEQNLKTMKDQIEKIDRDIFSKLE